MKAWQTIEYGYDERSGLYRKVHSSQVAPCAVVFARDQIAARLTEILPCPCVAVSSSEELAANAKPGCVLFVGAEMLSRIDASLTSAPIVVIFNDSTDLLPRIVKTIQTVQWVSHCMAESLLAKPVAKQHLVRLMERLVVGSEPGMFGEARTALLAQASHRVARFERICKFFAERGIAGRTITRIEEVYEELVTNALYDAPFEAGFFDRSVPRTEDVELPRTRACEISYGIENDVAYLRVRDTFGALSRARMVSVLARCITANVELDESRGGAGLGLWRVFSAATSVQIVIDPQKLTEILVGIASKDKRTGGPASVDLFVTPSASSRRHLISKDEHDLVDHSITLVRVA